MQIEVKTVKLTKSKIMQMDYIGIPSNPLTVVLGWVNIDKKKYTIVKSGDNYYRADFVTEVEGKQESVQFPLPDGGWEFPTLTKVRYRVYNSENIATLSVNREERLNVKQLDEIIAFKKKTSIAGQIYY